jgi:predicted TIM-barrel fold metal-dependent hydrolase
MTTTMSERTDAFSGTHRILVSGDAHGGAPLGELEGVMRRVQRDEGSAANRGPRLIDDGSGLNRSPQVHPEDRLREMGRDGVSAEVIYGSTGMFPGGSLEDAIVRCQKTNDWSAETYGGYLNVMAPSIALPLPAEPYGGGAVHEVTEDVVKAAAAELKRAAALGLRPGMMPDTSQHGYNRPDWNPIWEAACEADVALSFHVGIGTNPVQSRNPGGAIANYVTVAAAVIRTLAQLCASGTLATFPELKVVFTESNAGWLAWAMHQMDEAHKKHGHWAKPKLELPPSEYARRQVQVTFQEDPIGVANRHYTGLHCLIWGSDYPHWEGTWPRSREAVDDLFRGIPDDEVDQMVRGNAVETFKFKLD